VYKVLQPLQDAYITDRVVSGNRVTGSNVGAAGSLDLFKLYGMTATKNVSGTFPNVELSRLLVQFDLSPLRALVASSLVDVTNPSFSCRMRLHDVYGGQPTPSSFTVAVFPLSASFDEGLGRDVVLYSDVDVCSFASSSHTSSWFMSGCMQGGDDRAPCDYLTASRGTNLRSSQFFPTGEEDLDVDVTAAVSSALAGLIPDRGFRVAFDASLENDQRSYFVKRFASRTAFDVELRPELVVRFDDSIQDDSSNVYLDSPSVLFLYNYVRNAPANLVSGTTPLTGSNCLQLQLVTPVSGGLYSLFFTGSQHSYGRLPAVGIYSASITVLAADPALQPQWQASGSITFTPVWRSPNGQVSFLTGSTIKAYPPQRGSTSLDPKRYDVSLLGIRDTFGPAEQAVVRINIFDYTAPYFRQAVRQPVEAPGIVVRDVHYQVRDAYSGRIAVPFDMQTNSTRASSDANGMYFKLDTSNLVVERSYVIDLKIITGNNQQLYKSASPPFRVDGTV